MSLTSLEFEGLGARGCSSISEVTPLAGTRPGRWRQENQNIMVALATQKSRGRGYEILCLKTSKSILSGALPHTCIISPCHGHSAPWETVNFQITLSQRMRQNTKGECFRYPALKFKFKLHLSLVFQTDFFFIM